MDYVGVDIGGMSIKAGIVTEQGEILGKMSVVTEPHAPQEKTVKAVADLVKNLLQSYKIAENEVGGVGMGIPGTIDGQRGVIVYANNINFENVPMVEDFKKYVNVETKIGNDANCAALGEVRFGSGKGYTDAVFVTLGTGVGSGIVINGEIFEGIGGAGAEAGHMCIVSGGEPCSCGRLGCWEAYASATALMRDTARAMEKSPASLMHDAAKEEGKVSGRTAFIAARKGDEAGLEVVRQYEEYVAEGLVNLVNIFRPQALLIGGGVSHEGDYFIDALQALVDKNSYGGHRNPRVRVLKATLGNDAGILGAAALVMPK